MKKNLSILALLMICAAGYTFYTDRHSTPQTPGLTPTTMQEALAPAPDFSFTDLKGKKHSLADFRGKIVVLNFWASWCAPCVIEFPQIIKLAEATKDESVFLFLSQDDSIQDIEKFLKKYGKGLPQRNVFIAQDQNKNTARTLYQTYKLPETYLIDAYGMMREKIIGADVDWSGKPMQAKIKAMRQP